ncbi:MAG TPA: squalene synthase HpnC [Caldimonas sp.]|nr:squalene synthase HpnC [Caldimonas sp.]
MSVAHYENFPVASRLVPSALRPAVVAIYDFARGADDIADEGDAPAAARLAQLDRYEAALDAIARGEDPSGEPFASLAVAIRRHRLPLAPLRDLLSAFRQDVRKTRYATYAELLDYCSRSANPIGRMLLHLYKVTGADELRRADSICTGLQLANFWQDIAVDWTKGRLYLPAEDLVRFHVDQAQIAEGRCDDGWRQLLAFEVQRARSLLESGRRLEAALPLRLAIELKLVVAGGLRILRAIDAAGGNVFRHRPRLGTMDWIALAAAALRR